MPTPVFFTRSHRPARPLLFYPALTLAYVLSGKLGLLLAVPPGYATAIFPPAGIAVAAMLVGGWASLPGTFFGSFLLNLWVGGGVSESVGAAVLAAFVIAAGSAAQAAIAGEALRRAIGYPMRLDHGRELARLLLLVPICCLTSATLSLAGLAMLGVIRPEDLAGSWITWWIGDTLGVLVLLPLVLVIAGEPRSLWRSRGLSVALPMVLFFALFVAIFVLVSRWEHDAALLEFRMLSQQLVDRLRTGLDEQDVFLLQLQRSFSGPAALSRADFRSLVEDFRRRFPTVQAIEWAPRVERAERVRFEAAQQAELPGFAIREIGPAGAPRVAGERPQYYPVTYVEPYAGNQKAVGFDLASSPDRAAAAARAEASRTVAATPPIRLVQETGKEPGVLLLRAVRTGPNGPGLVLVVLRMGTFMRGLLASERSQLDARLVDVARHAILYNPAWRGSGGADFAREVDFGGRRFMLRTAPTAAYVARHRMWQSWAVLVTGVFSTGLLGALLLLGTGYARRIETVVDERTRDLETVNSRLQQEIRERRQAEAALRQAQRMEAIGQLTGGIAHDFNNLLMVVSGNAALLAQSAPDEAARRRAAAIAAASERGERLTRQLLAFSRRQTLRPEAIDLTQRMREIGEMLARSLREDIAVNLDLPDSLWPVVADPAEFELALLNIGVNARDAMPEGGRFRVTARNVSFAAGEAEEDGLVGDFVELTLSDSGVGMEPEVKAHAFEPFFTTKEIGAGSGLGLSQVYGFARQSGGGATIASGPGEGTAIRLFLPRASATPEAAPTAVARASEAPAPAPARALLVEDDPEVAEVTVELLRDLGYEAVTAANGRAALELLQRDPAVAIVLSDIVMPGGTSGVDLARHLRQHRPELPVVLLTGHSRSAAQLVAEGFVLLEKPYRRDDLAAVIRAAAEARRGAPAAVSESPASETGA
ncbi:MAG TPA: CHASE domain-containing protein [Stellaceae bacterium]|nr:CHASE domain-containing protein [Stellaceae bacterium]